MQGSFSAVSTFLIARVGAFFRIFINLQDLHSFAPLRTQNFSKISRFCRNFRKILQNSGKFAEILQNLPNFAEIFGLERLGAENSANFGETPAKFRQNFVKIQQNSANLLIKCSNFKCFKISEKLAIFHYFWQNSRKLLMKKLRLESGAKTRIV